MSGEAQSVYVHLLHVDRKDSGCLRGVYDEFDAVLPADSSDFSERVNCATDVARMSHNDRNGIRLYHALDSIKHELAGLSARDAVKFDALLLELNERAHDCVVLHR